MQPRLLSALAAGLLLAGAAFVASPSTALADKELERELRLLYFDGKFDTAAEKLANAPDEVRNNPKLRLALADAATKFVKKSRGNEAATRRGLIAARENYAAARKAVPDNADAAESALEADEKLVELEIEVKSSTAALAASEWGVTTGEAALEGGADNSSVRGLLARLYAHRAKLSHKVNDFDRIVSDYGRGADLLASAAAESKKPFEAFGEAARIELDLATFVDDARPMEEEKRDDEAIRKAVEFAKQACESKGAKAEQYELHLIALRQAWRKKLEGDFGQPYMRELGKREGLKGVNLTQPEAHVWKPLDKTDSWDLIWERKYGDDDTAVQIFVKVWSFSQNFGGKGYDRVEDVAKLRFEAKSEGEFGEVASKVEPHKIGESKKGPEIWHWEVHGKHTDNRRPKHIAEWLWYRSKKTKETFQIRFIDWRNSPNLNEPDLVAFVDLALDLPKDDEKGKGKKKKKR